MRCTPLGLAPICECLRHRSICNPAMSRPMTTSSELRAQQPRASSSPRRFTIRKPRRSFKALTGLPVTAIPQPLSPLFRWIRPCDLSCLVSIALVALTPAVQPVLLCSARSHRSPLTSPIHQPCLNPRRPVCAAIALFFLCLARPRTLHAPCRTHRSPPLSVLLATQKPCELKSLPRSCRRCRWTDAP